MMRPSLAGAWFVERLLRRLAGKEDNPSEEDELEDEIKALVTEGLHDGLLEADTREMIEGVIELDDARLTHDPARRFASNAKLSASTSSGWTM